MNDLTRWNRKQRREIKSNSGFSIPGRNLPFVKRIHGSLKDFNKLREAEVTNDAKETHT